MHIISIAELFVFLVFMHYSQAHDIEEETKIINLGNHIMIVQDRKNQAKNRNIDIQKKILTIISHLVPSHDHFQI
jgi:hypothetical protein